MTSPTGYPIINDPTKAAADKIRTDASTVYDRVRGDGRLNAATITGEIAAAYQDAKASMDALQAKANGDMQALQKKRTDAAWGIDDIAGTDPGERAAASMAYRDAIDRASKISSEADGRDLLLQANDTGDELLARAIARFAYSISWVSLLDAYAADRPKAADAIAALGEDWSTRPSAVDLFAFALPTPPELVGMGRLAILAAAQNVSA